MRLKQDLRNAGIGPRLRHAFSLVLVGALVWLASGVGIVAQSGGNYFDKVTVGGDLDMYGTGVIRDSSGDTVQVQVTSGRTTVAGNAVSPNIYGGATGNAVASGVYGAVISGGGTVASGEWGTGTQLNVIQSGAHFATVGGGIVNTNGGRYATIAGGQRNTIASSGYWGTIGGGNVNSVSQAYGVVAGGSGNASQNGGAMLGGVNNASRAQFSVSVGGYYNEVDSGASYGTILGGYCNTVGTGNACLSAHVPFNRVVIGGGTANYGAVVNGDRNAVNGYMDSILNGFFNTVSDEVTATVAGAYTHTIAPGELFDSPASSIDAEYDFDTGIVTCHTGQNAIGGGSQNTIANASVLTYTQIITAYSEITPALVVSCNGGFGYIGTGVSNTITGTTAQYATVLNGYKNAVTGKYATVLNGYQSRADGEYSFASGFRAWARHAGAFVWSGRGETVYQSVAPDSFNVRASGGVTLTTGGAGLAVDGPVIVNGMAFTYTAPITITGVLTNVRLLFYQVP